VGSSAHRGSSWLLAGVPTKDATLALMAEPCSKKTENTPDQPVLERAKAAVVDGDRTGALALLHVLLTHGPPPGHRPPGAGPADLSFYVSSVCWASTIRRR
jgi:hypothetical protein